MERANQVPQIAAAFVLQAAACKLLRGGRERLSAGMRIAGWREPPFLKLFWRNPMPTPVDDDDHAIDDDQDPDAEDAIELLSDDHVEMQELFQEYDSLVDAKAEASERESLALQICTLLTIHTQIEEEIFYPAAQDVLDGDETVDDALAEHAQAKQLIAEIEAAAADDEGYDELVRQLGEVINQHIQEEEETLFVSVANAGLNRKDVGRQLFERREELLADLEAE